MMKRLVAYLALWTGMMGPWPALAQSPPPHDARAAFDFACTVLEYDCTNVPPPKVQWESLYNTYGWLGVYNGTDTIYMDLDIVRLADEVLIQSILAHETAHYLDVQLAVLAPPFSREDVCASEFRAWRVGNAYVVAHGRPDFADFTWAERYGCFQ